MGGAVWIDVMGAVQCGCRLLDRLPCLDSMAAISDDELRACCCSGPRCGAGEGKEGGAGKGMDEQEAHPNE